MDAYPRTHHPPLSPLGPGSRTRSSAVRVRFGAGRIAVYYPAFSPGLVLAKLRTSNRSITLASQPIRFAIVGFPSGGQSFAKCCAGGNTMFEIECLWECNDGLGESPPWLTIRSITTPSITTPSTTTSPSATNASPSTTTTQSIFTICSNGYDRT